MARVLRRQEGVRNEYYRHNLSETVLFENQKDLSGNSKDFFWKYKIFVSKAKWGPVSIAVNVWFMWKAKSCWLKPKYLTCFSIGIFFNLVFFNQEGITYEITKLRHDPDYIRYLSNSSKSFDSYETDCWKFCYRRSLHWSLISGALVGGM